MCGYRSILILVISITTAEPAMSYNRIKIDCCDGGYALSRDAKYLERGKYGNRDVVNEIVNFKCLKTAPMRTTGESNSTTTKVTSPDNTIPIMSEYCFKCLTKNTASIVNCSDPSTNTCGSIWEPIKFWDTDIMLILNIIQTILCLFVVVLYSLLDLGKKTYNRLVLMHSSCLFAAGCILTVLGVLSRCHREIKGEVVIWAWLALQYTSIASVLWLNVISFDMTLGIIRFRWIPGSFDNRKSEKKRKLLMYSLFAWFVALLPTAMAAIFEYYRPYVTTLKPYYKEYMGKTSVTVRMYFFLVPLITLFFNNVLFVLTTYKILKVQRSTEKMYGNGKNVLTKKYFLFLRLYLLMGAPWFFGMLVACIGSLSILKYCRIVQPLLWLLMPACNKKFRRKIVDKFFAGSCDNSKTENLDCSITCAV